MSVLTLASAQAHADWTSKMQAGFVMARGNTETETANAKFEVIREVERWKNRFGFSALYGETRSVTTAERWDAAWQLDHELSERTFWFFALRHEDDRYSGFDYQSNASTGAGRKLVDSDTTKLSAQLGIGLRSLRTERLTRDDLGLVIGREPGGRQEDVAGNFRLRFEHAFTDTAKVLNNVLVESGRNNTLAQNELALQVQMNAVLALSLGYSVRNNSSPPVNQRETDTLTTINLVYEMK